jgi:hypothetical protein
MYDELIEALQIFRKYEHVQSISAEHDEIFGGPDPALVLESDKVRLRELGWRPSEFGCFASFV